MPKRKIGCGPGWLSKLVVDNRFEVELAQRSARLRRDRLLCAGGARRRHLRAREMTGFGEVLDVAEVSLLVGSLERGRRKIPGDRLQRRREEDHPEWQGD